MYETKYTLQGKLKRHLEANHNVLLANVVICLIEILKNSII